MLMVEYIPACQIYSDSSSHVHQTLQMSDRRSRDKPVSPPPTNPTLLALKTVVSYTEPGLDYDMVDII